MKNWLEQFDRLTDGIVEGLKNIPPLFHANKRLINKLILFILALITGLMAVIWIFSALIESVVKLWNQNKEFIIIIFVIMCMIYSSIATQIDKRHKEKNLHLMEELERQQKNSSIQYTYLRLFLYKILDERLCNLIEVAKPVTPNQLNPVTPITIDDKHAIVYYNFQVHKLKTLPFSQGTDYVKNLISSHVIGKAQIEGIEGITAPVGDSLITPVYVDAVKDLGSTAVIVLVLDCDAYRKFKEMQGHTIQTRELVEHI